jgi:AraC-like DNA-binding protein
VQITRGASWIYFRLEDGTTGYRLWGVPTATDVVDLLAVVERSLSLEPHASLVDTSCVTGYAPDAFAALSKFVREHGHELRRAVTRLAVVRGQSPIGAMAAGFFDVEAAPYPTKTHATITAALRWARAADVRLAAAALDAALENAMHSGTIVHSVRAFIARDLGAPRTKDCAKSLGVSERSLQRLLAESGASFRDLVTDARIDRAKRLLVDTDQPISRVAQASGFNALGAFSTAFRRRTGMTPREFRQSGSHGPSHA